MRALLAVVVVLAIGFFVLVAVQQGSSGPTQGGATADSALQVSAYKLFSDYQRNEVAADNVYKGRSLAVSGVVSGINKDVFDKIYVELVTPNEFMNVQAHLGEGNESKAASLQVGETVTVVCTGAGMVIGSPMLDKCSFASEPVATGNAASAPLWPNGNATEPSPQAAPAPEAAPAPASQGAEPDATGIYKVGGAVSAPMLTYKVDPEIPQEARDAKMGGNVLVDLDVDGNGNPINVHAERVILINANGNASSGPLNGSSANNLGMDEKAVEAVKQYRFRPATLNGTPVPVELNVEVTFQIC